MKTPIFLNLKSALKTSTRKARWSSPEVVGGGGAFGDGDWASDCLPWGYHWKIRENRKFRYAFRVAKSEEET